MLPHNFKESLICVQKACQLAGLSFKYKDKDQILAEVTYPNSEKLFFIHNKNPFNSFTSARVCQDKALQAELYELATIPHPYTKSYFNPKISSAFNEYKHFQNINDIRSDILQNFEFPFFLKKNISSLSKGVHLVSNSKELDELLDQYFLADSDIIIIQSKITGQEYRVVSWKGEPLLAYKKGNKFSKNSHKAEKVDPQRFEKLTQSIHQALNINFFGADVIETKKGLFLIETNPNPACFYYNKFNGREDFTQVYLKCLQGYQN